MNDSADLIIAEGDDLIPDVLGLANNGTFGGGSSTGRLRVNIITDKNASGAPTVSNGLVISGVTTTSDIKVGTGATLNVYGGATFSGIITATQFKGDGSNLSGLASREFYGFKAVNEELVLIHTNNGADNISKSDFESFEDTMTAPSGLSFSINSAGELEMTI